VATWRNNISPQNPIHRGPRHLPQNKSLKSSSFEDFNPPEGYSSSSSSNNNKKYGAPQEFEENNDSRLSDEDLRATMPAWDDSVPRFNTVHLTGRIGNDAEPRYFDDGKVVVQLSLAVRRKYHWMERQNLNLQTGEEETDWYGLEIWGQNAEYVSKYVDKGMRVGVVGSLQVDEWTDKATQEPRNRVKIVVRDIDILETRAESELRRGNRGGSNNYSQNSNTNNNRGPSFYTSDNDDDGDGPSSAGTGGFFDN